MAELTSCCDAAASVSEAWRCHDGVLRGVTPADEGQEQDGGPPL